MDAGRIALCDDEIGALLVVDSSTDLAGVFSEPDLTRAVADGVDLEESCVSECMTAAPVTADVEDSLTELVREMNEFAIRHVVITEDCQPVGMVSMRDIVATLGVGPVETSSLADLNPLASRRRIDGRAQWQVDTCDEVESIKTPCGAPFRVQVPKGRRETGPFALLNRCRIDHHR